MELVSAIISTYNRPMETLKRAVKSVINQTYSAIEVIVVNDYPINVALSSEIRVMLNELDNRIVYLVHTKNRGACVARNTGLKRANGKFVAFLDDDDEWLPEKIEEQIKYMNKDTGLVYCDSIICSGETSFVHHVKLASKNNINAILRGNFIGSTSFPLLRTEYVRAVGGFDENLVSNQDYDLWIRMIEKYPIEYINKALIRYYLSEDSTFKRNNKKYIDGDLYLQQKYCKLFRKYPDDYSYHLNDVAISALIFKRDLRMYWKYKMLAFKYCLFHRYNFFLLFIKTFNKLKKVRI